MVYHQGYTGLVITDTWYLTPEHVHEAGSTCEKGRGWIIYSSAPSVVPTAMSYGSPALIDRSIAQLDSLAAFLTDEIQQPWTTTLLPLSEQRPCKEVLLTIRYALQGFRPCDARLIPRDTIQSSA